MADLVRNTIKLCLITLVAGLLLGCVYEITKEPRKKQEEKKTQEAYQKVFSNANTFEPLSADKAWSKEIEDYLASSENGTLAISKKQAIIEDVVVALDDKKQKLGYVITVTSKEGFGGDITYTVGVSGDGVVTGIAILSISETAGLGMKATDSSFLNQYKDKKVGSYQVTKKGEEGEDKIDAISGATITSNAITTGVNAALKAVTYLNQLP